MSSNDTFKVAREAVASALVDTTRTIGHIANEDLAFQRSSNPSIAPLLDRQSSRLLELYSRLAQSASTGTDIVAPRLSDADSVEDNWKGIVDVVDSLLEKADACLDEYTGVIKRLSPSRQVGLVKSTNSTRKQFPSKVHRTQDILKPQLLFQKVPTNDESTAWKPILRSKPHAIVPLQESIDPVSSEHGTKLYKHPYETEITQSRYPPSVYQKSDPIAFKPLVSTTATFVDTLEGVAAMLAELRSAKEIAIDLEHHDTHSYVGIVSLMQISTRDRDWIVDTLKPWREDLQVLNEVFTDPSILKVFHGSSMDMIWLQRDLGLYVVGLFDTYHASVTLSYPKHSLAYLLTKFVNFDAAKQYQMADWRIRPLPEEMFNYARSDTHFLLYIYDCMRNELLDHSDGFQPKGNLVDNVLAKSKEEAMRRYEYYFYDAEHGSGPIGWYNMLNRTPTLFTRQQFAVFRAVHQWRDSVARQEDESIHAVMPKRTVFNISKAMPMDMVSLLGCSHPVSAPMRAHTKELLEVIRQAKRTGATGPEMKDVISEIELLNPDLRTDTRSTKRQLLPFTSANQTSPKTNAALGDNLSIRSDTSRFWGLTSASGSGHGPIPTRLQDQKFLLATPLPHLTAEVFGNTTDGRKHETAIESPLDVGARAEHQYIKSRASRETNVFVVKQLGGARKRKTDQVDDVPEPAEYGSLNGNEEGGTSDFGEGDDIEIPMNALVEERLDREKAERKGERKAERKRQKKLDKEQRKQEEVQARDGKINDGAHDDDEAFDYANASSVLHAKRGMGNGNGREQAFNPYTKALDAPKGMKKSRKEMAGKSLTYKA